MSNFRLSISHDLGASLASDEHERPIDRVTAFSRSSRLGTLLWRVKYNLDAKAYKQTVLLLANKTNCKTLITRKLAQMVLNEWLYPQCRKCNGAREFRTRYKLIKCWKCAGTGLHRAGDRERSAYMGLSIREIRNFDPVIQRVHSKLQTMDKMVNRGMNQELERDF